MFPIMLDDVQNAKFVVVGGGVIAYHKVQNLLRFGVTPTVVSPEFHPALRTLENESRVVLIEKKVEWPDVEDAFLTLLVTNDEELNDELAGQLKATGKLVVHASNPILGNAQIPAVAIRGKLVISVSTSGASPTLAKRIRDSIAEQYDETYEDYLDFLFDIRQYVKEHVADRADRRTWLKQATDPLYLHQPTERERFKQELYTAFPANVLVEPKI